jgi:hypothetical protein
MRLHRTQHAGSLMSHGPPTGHLSHYVGSKRLATNKLPGKASGLDHVYMTMLAAAAKNKFGDALVEFKIATFGLGRPAPAHGIA